MFINSMLYNLDSSMLILSVTCHFYYIHQFPEYYFLPCACQKGLRDPHAKIAWIDQFWFNISTYPYPIIKRHCCQALAGTSDWHLEGNAYTNNYIHLSDSVRMVNPSLQCAIHFYIYLSKSINTQLFLWKSIKGYSKM